MGELKSLVTDEQILNFFNSEQKSHAFTLLMDKYQERVYWHIRRMVLSHEDANDISQNMWLKVWRKLDTFKGNSQLYTWLYRIATNECLTFIRSKKKKGTVALETEDYDLSSALKADPYFDGDDYQIKIQEAIQSLPDKQKAVFNLRYFDEMKYEEMSEVLETSVGALKASYHHAVKKIEAFIKEED